MFLTVLSPLVWIVVYGNLVKQSRDLGLQPFQEYFTYIKPIDNQRWAKTGVPGEKPSDLLVQNLESHMYPVLDL